MSQDSLKNTAPSGNTLAPTLTDTSPLPVAKFNGNCLIRNSIYNFRKVINLYISYTLNSWSREI